MPLSRRMSTAQSVFLVSENDGARNPRTGWLVVLASDLQRPLQVGSELLRLHEGQQLVRVAVRGDLVPPPLDFPDQVGKPVGHPAEHEERRLDAVRAEQVQQAAVSLRSTRDS